MLKSQRFQYVTLQLQGPLRRAKTDLQRANALQNLPRGLNETYERALLDIPIEDRVQAIRALKWLSASLRPLILDELAEASRIDIDHDPILVQGTELDSPMSIWEMLPPGLVTLTPASKATGTWWTQARRTTQSNCDKLEPLEHQRGDLVAFAHSSFSEYLQSKLIQHPDCEVKDFFIGEEAANAYVTESCMAYHIHASQNITCERHFPLWEYAAKCWMQHLENIPRAKWSLSAQSKAETILQSRSPIFVALIKFVSVPLQHSGGEDAGDLPCGFASLDDVPEPLYYVARNGYMALLKMLLMDQSTKINSIKGVFGTALNAACVFGDPQIVQEFLQHGADPWLGNKSYPCALAAAMTTGYKLEIIHSLVQWDKGVDLYSRCRAVGYSPLIAATSLRSEKLITYLVLNGIPVDSPGGYYGNTLQLASYETMVDVFGLLLAKGASTELEGGQYGHALQAAASRGNMDFMKSLLDKGANVNAQSGVYVYGTALQAGALTGNPKVISFLLSKGAKVNASGGKYGYALQAAAYMGHRACAQALLDAGAAINTQGGFYGNALQAAVAGGDRDMSNLLLKTGAIVQPPGPLFDAVLSRIREKKDARSAENAERLREFQRGHWCFRLTDPAHGFIQNPMSGCWETNSPGAHDPWVEWWKNALAEWRTPW